jgi:outer membrane protein, heavy metal efflux system
MIKKTLLLFIAIGHLAFAKAQDKLTIADCEKLFLKNNLLLLAEQYNIDAAKASRLQAKIWEQPYFSGEINALNPGQNRLLDIGSNGQKGLAIQQLIKMGGKRKNEIAFAKKNIQLAEAEFESLLQNLRFELHVNFYQLHFDLQKAKKINFQIAQIDSLSSSYSIQVSKSNIALKELVRLQSLSLNLKNDLIEMQDNLNQEELSLKLLLNNENEIIPLIEQQQIENLIQTKISRNVDQLLTIALQKNRDYLTFLKKLESKEEMLRWQKSLARPDINIGASYDQRGGAFNNQTNLTFGIPLPLWNKNKGNIQNAKAELNSLQTEKEFKQLELKSKIEQAYKNWNFQQLQYLQISNTNTNNLQIVYEGMMQNFQKRNISLLEFTDFMESYNQSVLVMNELEKKLLLNYETLNLLVGENIQ